jgi:beta-glucosidase
MSAYNSVNGEWCGQNPELLTGILKEMWGFEGFVMTDFIFGMRNSEKAALAGQDVEMPFAMIHNRDLKKLVKAGKVPMSRVDDAALRVLRQQIRFAQGRDPKNYGPDQVGTAANRGVAYEAALKSIVLLKNEGALLPLKNLKRVVVVGRLANTPNTGDAGSSNTQPDYVITPLQGLKEALGPGVTVDFDDGADPARAAQLAQGADAVLLVVGYTSKDEGEYVGPDMVNQFVPNFPKPSLKELPLVAKMTKVGNKQRLDESFSPGGDRASLALRPADEALIQAVAAANPRVVTAIMAGSAVITEAWREQVPAILMLWYPGMEGGRALADLLLGEASPSGRLPITFPARAEDLPYFDRNATQITYDLWHGYRKLERDGAKPAFPFGFGLSYTTFRLSDLCLKAPEIAADGALEAWVNVTNTGEMPADDVVQFYVSYPGSAVERAPRELKAFRRVTLQPGETKEVRVRLPAHDLAYYDPARGWTVEKIGYTLIAAHHSLDEAALRAAFNVK